MRIISFLTLMIMLLAACAGDQAPVVLSAEEATQTAAPPTVVLVQAQSTPSPAGVNAISPTGTLRLGVQTFNGFDPLSATNAGTEQVQALVYETLLTYDAAGEVVPQLAELPLPGEDVLTWTLSIRKGINFHRGVPLDGIAAANALQSVLAHPPGDAPWTLAIHEFRRVVESVSGDEGTITLRLREPYPALAQLLAEQSLAITDSQGGGTGPFSLEAENPDDDTLSFVANSNYWGGAPALERVQVQVFNTEGSTATIQTALLDALSNGEIDLAAHEEIIVPHPASNYAITYGPTRQVWVIFNRTSPPLDQIAMRLGLNLSLDRATLVDALGLGGVASPDATFPYDPLRAREMFANGGLPDGFDINLWRLVPANVTNALHDELDAVHVGIAVNGISEYELLWGLTGDVTYLAGEEPSASLRRWMPSDAFLGAWARDWIAARWFVLAGWGQDARLMLDSDPPGMPLYVAPLVFTHRAGLDGLGITSGGWPRIGAQTRLP